ncbi:MAG: hypothetical protein U0452_04350 [Anaerolineae bacterium]
MTHDPIAGVFRCKMCGKVMDAPRETLEEAAARLAARGQRPDVKLTHRGLIDNRARVLFENGQDKLWLDDRVGAMEQFKLALQIQDNFSDAYLWLAKLAADDATKRDHLGAILANDPGHHEALVRMMALDGRITEAEAEEILSRPYEPTPAELPADQVPASTAALLCPKCGGHLEVQDDGDVVCRFCGHVLDLEDLSELDSAGDVLGAALLERRARPVRWLIGSRLVHCSQCGAERTLMRDQMSAQCAFCGSAQVMVQDALGVFEQPDGLIPFRVTEEAAKAAVRDALKGVGERIRGFVDVGNQVVSATVAGLYLPFWVFDAQVEVTVTVQDKRAAMGDRRRLQLGDTGYRRETLHDGVTGLFVPGVTSPSRDLLAELGDFDMDTMRPYEPALLATYPAGLYTLDVDKTSLDARSIAARRARERALAMASSSEEISVTALPVQMSFMLVLAPVWVCTLYERDGDVRTALVQGLTGDVVMGRARSPDRKPV